MTFSKIAAGLLASASLVAGHGYVSGIVANGKYYTGYLVTEYPYESSAPDSIAWSTSATDLGFVDGSEYQGPNIICHEDAKPGALTAPVKAGSEVDFEWTTWPDSHHGPLITYMAPCDGDCSKVDKTKLEFFKIDAKGLISGSNTGTWATDQMIKNNNTWSVTIPKDISNGNYVLRHEIIALHSASQKDGAQNYVQCVNVKVTGGGDENPAGTLGESLYKDTDAGIKFNIYTDFDSYPMPGPKLYSAN